MKGAVVRSPARKLLANRCARSRCPRPAVKLEGGPAGLCLPHAQKNGKSRYGVQRVQTAHRSFASKAERTIDDEVELGVLAGEYTIEGRQVWYAHEVVSVVTGHRITLESYVADLVIWDHREDRRRVIDAKHKLLTDEFKKKRKWMLHVYGIEVEIWDASKGLRRKAPRGRGT